jgi:DNA helicase-2/ATP-dependent DNA helicase PcrA
MMILYRINSQSRAIEESLIKSEIPYILVNGTSFYNRAEIMDMLAFLKVIDDPSNDEAMLRVLKVMFKFRTLKLIENKTNNKNIYSFLPKSNIQEIINFLDKINIIIGFKFKYDTIKNYLSLIIEQFNLFNKYDDSKILNIKSLLDVCENKLNDNDGIKNFLKFVNTLQCKRKEDFNGVQLMTIHHSKGLESKVVFLIGLSQGLLPFKNDKYDNDLNEERRLCYVGITRAIDKLYTSYIRHMWGKYLCQSQFIKEMYNNK